MNQIETASQSREGWNQLKRKLLSSNIISDSMVELFESEAKRKIEQKGRYPNNLYIDHWDLYLNDISSSLERCLSFRREARDLEIAAVKASVDYDTFVSTSKLSKQLEISGLGIEPARIRLDAVSKAIDETLSGEIGSALRSYLIVEKNSLMAAIDNLNERSVLISKRWDEARSVAESYHLRHNTSGNAHNFAQRYDRVLDLYADELFDVVAKAPYIARGASMLFGSFSAPPAIDEPDGYLDRMVTWTRDLTRFINGNTELETRFDLVIPLVQPWRGIKEKCFIDSSDFYDIFSSDAPVKEVRFDFNDVFFGMERVRLSGLGISFGSKPWGSEKGSVGWRDTVTGYRLRVTIHTPEQKDDEGKPYRRPPLIFGNVAIHGAEAPVAWYDGANCVNLRPDGTWRLSVEDLAVWLDDDKTSLQSGFFSSKVLDIKLHMRVTALLADKSGSYFSK